jgi:hypothetical protein
MLFIVCLTCVSVYILHVFNHFNLRHRLDLASQLLEVLKASIRVHVATSPQDSGMRTCGGVFVCLFFCSLRCWLIFFIPIESIYLLMK